ncbi:MAG: glycosyltransferase [Bacteroidota bacterium]
MNTYFERYAYPEILFTDEPDQSLSISVVIPCFNEPDITPTLNSLNNCTSVPGVEVIIIVNEPDNCNEEIRKQNLVTIQEIEKWRAQTDTNFKLLVHHLVARKKDAGVGLARKVGMDEAARRFETVKNPKGVICCFDADATCEPNYLVSIQHHFVMPAKRPHGASIYYEHDIDDEIPLMSNGIIQYELHLRYYSHALAYTGFPYPFQTVGSSMVVRSDIYQKIGGMNKRKAGEDFYFLHRVMPTGNYINIKDTVIYPSARISDRVPFGTGKAMQKWQEENPEEYYTYNLHSFTDLKQLFSKRNDFFSSTKETTDALISSMPESIQSFLQDEAFESIIVRLKKQSTNLVNFEKNWFHFFDGFKVLKFLHFARDHYHPNKPVKEEAGELVSPTNMEAKATKESARDWLLFYREQDSQG